MKQIVPHPSSECNFCRAGTSTGVRYLCRNDNAYAFLSNAPIVPGHTLIVPSRCVRSVDDLEKHELQAIFEIRSRLKPLLERLLEAEGFNYAWNEGLVAGQTVPHLHLHMVPCRAGDIGVVGYDPRKLFYRPGPRNPLPAAELIALAERIRASADSQQGLICEAAE